MKVKRISGALGAEILGIDLSVDLSTQTVADLRDIWLDNLVIFFRDQHLAPPQFLLTESHHLLTESHLLEPLTALRAAATGSGAATTLCSPVR